MYVIFFIISLTVLLRIKFFSDKSCRENKKKLIFYSIIFCFECRAVYDNVEKYCRAGQVRRQYGACALHTGYLRPKMHTQIMQYLFLIHWNNSCTNTPQSYVIPTLPVLWVLNTLTWKFQRYFTLLLFGEICFSAVDKLLRILSLTYFGKSPVRLFCVWSYCSSAHTKSKRN
jgi:hypothetical protein